jgi:hypothetical protein
VGQADAEGDGVRLGIIDAATIGTADGALDGWLDWDALRLLERNRMGTIEGATLVPLDGLSDVVLLGSAHDDAEGEEIVRIEGSIVGVVLGSALVLEDNTIYSVRVFGSDDIAAVWALYGTCEACCVVC